MELPIYETLEDFKEYFEDALAEFPELKGNKLKLLRQYLKTYEQERKKAEYFYIIPNDRLLQNIPDSNDIEELYINSFKTQLEIAGCITLFSDYHLLDSGEISQQEYLEDVKKQNILNHNYRNFIKENPLYEKECKYNDKYFENIDAIINFIIDEIQNEKNILLRFHNSTPPHETPENKDYPTIKFSTPEKIALLQNSGLDLALDNVTGDVAEQKYRLLSALFGTGVDVIKKYYTGANKITGAHRKRANDFLNNNFK